MKKKCCGQNTNFLHFFKHLDSDCSIKLKLTIDTFFYSSLICGYSGFFQTVFFPLRQTIQLPKTEFLSHIWYKLEKNAPSLLVKIVRFH